MSIFFIKLKQKSATMPKLLINDQRNMSTPNIKYIEIYNIAETGKENMNYWIKLQYFLNEIWNKLRHFSFFGKNKPTKENNNFLIQYKPAHSNRTQYLNSKLIVLIAFIFITFLAGVRYIPLLNLPSINSEFARYSKPHNNFASDYKDIEPIIGARNIAIDSSGEVIRKTKRTNPISQITVDKQGMVTVKP